MSNWKDLPAEFFLEWFSTEIGIGSIQPLEKLTDEFVGQEKLAITEAQVREWFFLQPDDPELDGLIVRASQREQLQKLVKHQIDLNHYDYFVAYMIDNT